MSFSSSLDIFSIELPVFVRKSCIAALSITRPSLLRMDTTHFIMSFSLCSLSSHIYPFSLTALNSLLRLSTSFSTNTITVVSGIFFTSSTIISSAVLKSWLFSITTNRLSAKKGIVSAISATALLSGALPSKYE